MTISFYYNNTKRTLCQADASKKERALSPFFNYAINYSFVPDETVDVGAASTTRLSTYTPP